MRNTLDKAMGIHDDALRLRAYRSNLIASNIANTDTPRFKAKDIDFKQVLSRQVTPGGFEPITVRKTNARHIANGLPPSGAVPQYRNPQQPSLDGNTVDADAEYTRFAENAVRYQSSLQLLSGRFKGLMTAIKGE